MLHKYMGGDWLKSVKEFGSIRIFPYICIENWK